MGGNAKRDTNMPDNRPKRVPVSTATVIDTRIPMPFVIQIAAIIAAMHDGEITGEFQREEFSEQSIMTCAIGRRKE